MIERSYKNGEFRAERCSFHIYCTKKGGRIASELSKDEIYEICAKQIWNIVRNDGTPDRKKYLGIFSLVERRINPQTQEEYDFHSDEYIKGLKKAFNENIAQKYIKEYLAKRATGYKEYDYYHPRIWVENKKYQLYNHLTTVPYIVTFIKSYQQGYRFVTYGRQGRKKTLSLADLNILDSLVKDKKDWYLDEMVDEMERKISDIYSYTSVASNERISK
ncbi:hypothetical protein GLOIN_2v1779906 [Rhizophagus clarus]|uniref:Uncharacterized protein n=1 Tax=Rhizophagus clarus TaxID=94130 RepID=A0A8H3M8V0_9GLOM|nr:hypothetical protein GLOIN_2v1779906 [Rhizophagus clarus]